MSTPEDRLTAAGLRLPAPAAPVASYVPFTISGDLCFISGQLPFHDGQLVTGLCGDTLDLDQGAAAALACGLGVLAQLKAACEGDLGRVAACVKLGGFVASTATFTDHPKVMNGASDLMLLAFGDAGRHARAAVGVSSLPLGAAVEVDGIFRIG